MRSENLKVIQIIKINTV